MTASFLEERLRFSTRHWILPSDESVLVGRQSVIVRRVVGGDQLIGVLASFRTLLSETALSVHDICEQLSNEYPETFLVDAIKQLVDIGILEFESRVERNRGEGSHVDMLRTFLESQAVEYESGAVSFDATRFALSGSPGLVDRLASACEEACLKAEVLPLGNGNGEETADGGPSDRLREALTLVDLVVGCAADPVDRLVQFPLINRICVELEKPWLALALDGDVIQLGPLFVPGETACFRCMELREESRLPHPAEFIHFREHIGKVWKPILNETPSPLRDTAANLAAMELLRIGTRSSFPSTYQTLIEIDTRSFQTAHHVLLRVPFCDCCGVQEQMPFRKHWNI